MEERAPRAPAALLLAYLPQIEALRIGPWSIYTSHVERVNLTARTLMKRFTRLSLCFSKKLENLAAAVAIYVAYYNFC